MQSFKVYGIHEKSIISIIIIIHYYGGARLRSWLRHHATNRNVAGSIPDGVIGIFS
jgi:hypothetical protein